MKLTILITLFLWLTAIVKSCSQDGNLTIYLLKGRYSKEIQSKVNSIPDFKGIDILGGHMIDPEKKGVIDLESVAKHVRGFYPDASDSGQLCINLENRLYQNLKDYDKGNPKYEEAVSEFSSMLQHIKAMRPNVKIGIYGLPYRTYSKSQLKWNHENKLDPVLSLCDYIYPSLYLIYPDKEHGESANDQYLRQNLNTAFEYGSRLKKPVVPFVWYVVHPINKKYGYELLSKREIIRYIDFIRNYKYHNGASISGIVWWDTPTPFNQNRIKSQDRQLTSKGLTVDNIFKQYMQYLNFSIQ